MGLFGEVHELKRQVGERDKKTAFLGSPVAE